MPYQLGERGIYLVATDSFEMSTYRLSSECSSSELRGYKYYYENLQESYS
jgi:hypothetical protein